MNIALNIPISNSKSVTIVIKDIDGKMYFALNTPTSILESAILDIKEIDGNVTDIKRVTIKAAKDLITITARATVNALIVKPEINITITLQLQLQSGNIICQNVSAKGDNAATTALVKQFEDTITSSLNSMIRKGLSKFFIHHLDISTDNIRIVCAPR